MKAIYYEEHGGPEVLKYGEVEAPVAGPGQVVIDIKAASLNHIDLFMRRGMPGVKVPFPHIPGCDASGIVAAVGEGVAGPAVGDRVLMNPSLSCGKCEFCIRGDASLCLHYVLVGELCNGTCCEQIAVPADAAIPIPDSLSFEDAASIPLVFLTAWRMLITRGKLKPGENVLILGAAAGVGTAAIQIAKAAGARVIAAASNADKLDLCRDLGADVLIDYSKDDLVKRVGEATSRRGADVVVDYVGADTWLKSLQSLVRGGRLLTCGATTGYSPKTDLRHVFYRQLTIIGSTMGSKNDLTSALKMIVDGHMRPVVGAVYDLEDTAQAHAAMEARKVLGKIVIRIG